MSSFEARRLMTFFFPSDRFPGALSTAAAALRFVPALVLACFAASAAAPAVAAERLWLDSAGRPSRQAIEAVSLLRDAHQDGLDPQDYDAPGLAQEVERLSTRPAGEGDLARFDARLSDAVLRLMRHLQVGRVDPASVGFRVPVREGVGDLPALLRFALAQDRLPVALGELRPSLPQYALLRSELARYRGLAQLRLVPPAMEGWPLPLRPGGEAAGLQSLWNLLLATGDMPARTAEPPAARRYQGALVEAVRRFQRRHSLHDDGVIGRATRAALMVPADRRVRQIAMAMERVRWLPALRGKRVVAINIPMFTLWAAQPDAQPPLVMDVIVGKALDTHTPVLMAEMRSIVFRPYWNVPTSILRKELLPLIERDPGYLKRNRMEIVLGAGDDAAPVAPTPDNLAALRRGALRLRQMPGPGNSLGLAKFVFPNVESVYLHGTPVASLFDRERRDFSHGCVRVRDPVALAQWALAQPQWDRERILEAMHADAPLQAKLAQPVTVLLYYMTAMVAPGTTDVRFAPDVYGHDARLERALRSLTRP